jgi:hypothetical protein
MSDSGEKFWYNLVTGEVEFGRLSPSVNRAGPYETREEAARAPESLKEHSDKWRADEENDR